VAGPAAITFFQRAACKWFVIDFMLGIATKANNVGITRDGSALSEAVFPTGFAWIFHVYRLSASCLVHVCERPHRQRAAA
ncbi:hypothetical protein ABTH88_22435, partial [Acinetobacter baumannii]